MHKTQFTSSRNFLQVIAIIIVFLIGGVIQVYGVLSYTKLSLVLGIILLAYGILTILHKKRLDLVFISMLFLFLLWGIISSIINSSDLLNIFSFNLQVVLVFGTFYLVYRSDIVQTQFVINILFWIGIIQFPIIILQRVLFKNNIQFNGLNIRYEDIGFGTFFPAEDHPIGFLLISLLILILNRSFNVKYKVVTIIYLIISIFTTNSNITILLLIVLGGIQLIKNAKFILLLTLLTGFMTYLVTKESESIQMLVKKIEFLQSQITEDVSVERAEALIKNSSSSRKEVIIYYLNNRIPIIGDGSGSYYNLKTREYFNANFGQSLWYYKDYGVIGLILSLVIIYTIKLRYNSNYSNLVFILMITYSFFANIFSSIAFLLLYNFLLAYLHNNEKHSSRTVSRLA